MDAKSYIIHMHSHHTKKPNTKYQTNPFKTNEK